MPIVKANRALASRDRRALRLGMFVAVPVVAHALVVRPYVAAVRQSRERILDQRNLLEREERLAADLPAIRSQFERAAAATRLVRPRTYVASDSVLAAAAFGRDVTEALTEAGLAVQRIEMRDSVARFGSLQEFAVDVRAQGDFEAILNALARLEGHARLIHVSRLAIERLGDGAPGRGQTLSFTALMRGYAQ